MHRRWMSLLGALFALTLLAASCSDESPTDADQGGGSPSVPSETESPADAGGGGADLTIADFAFSPTDLSVTDGQSITVTNIGHTSHTFTTDDGAIDKTISEGETLDITLTGVTTGGFHCRFHSQMVGTLTVG